MADHAFEAPTFFGEGGLAPLPPRPPAELPPVVRPSKQPNAFPDRFRRLDHIVQVLVDEGSEYSEGLDNAYPVYRAVTLHGVYEWDMHDDCWIRLNVNNCAEKE